jgi:hypothetical protein
MCCPGGALGFPDDLGRCSQAHYWTTVGRVLDNNLIAQHNETHNVQLETFTDWPSAATKGGSTWARHWVSSYLLTGVNYIEGTSWHDSTHDYLQVARGDVSPYHGEYSHLQVETIDTDEGGGAYGRYTWNVGRDSIRLSCAHFNRSPVRQTSTLVHEAWHMVYGDHDDTVSGKDFYWAREKGALRPGEMDYEYPPLNRTRSSPLVTQQSVFQTQWNYLCDVITTPQAWITNRIIDEATVWVKDVHDLHLDPPPPIVCDGTGTIRGAVPAPPTPGAPPRFVSIRLAGEMVDGTPVVGEDTRRTINLDAAHLPVGVPGGSFDEFPPVTYRRTMDDTEFRFIAQARLNKDGETVEVRFQGEFYEDPPDCEMDTSPYSVPVEGSQCLGLEGPHRWKTIPLNSQVPILAMHYPLTNCWNEDCEDSADFTITAEIDWY